MSLRKEFIEFVKRQIGKERIYSRQGTVTEVDEKERSCKVIPDGDNKELKDVRLQGVLGQQEGLVVIPKKNTKVIVTFLSTSTAFVSLTSEVEKVLLKGEVVINEGKNGGVVTYPELKKELETERARLDAVIEALKTSPTTSDDGGAAYKSAISAAISGLSRGKYGRQEITDDEFTH